MVNGVFDVYIGLGVYKIVYINRPIVFFKTAADVRTMKSLFHGIALS